MKKSIWKPLIAACLALILVGGGSGFLYQQAHAVTDEKALLVNQILTNTQAQLSNLSVEELEQLLESGEVRIPIGKSAAVLAAQQYSGTLDAESITTEVDAELDERFPRYEVELYHPTAGKFEYFVDPWTGQVLVGQANILGTATSQTSTADTTATTTAKTDSTTAAAQEITEAKAKEIALNHAGVAEANTTALTVRRDREHGITVYKVDFYAGNYEYDYEVNAVTGAILEADKEWDNKSASTTGQTSDATAAQSITEVKAKEIALNHAGVAEKDAVSLYVKQEREYGKIVYEVDFYAGGYEYDYEIDSVTGAILEAEKELDDKGHSTSQSTAAAAPAASPQTTPSAAPQTEHPASTAATTPSTGSTQQITAAKAKEIALNHAGLSESQVSKLKCELDHEDGRQVYEVEFRTAATEYEYEILASDGSIWDYEWEAHH